MNDDEDIQKPPSEESGLMKKVLGWRGEEERRAPRRELAINVSASDAQCSLRGGEAGGRPKIAMGAPNSGSRQGKTLTTRCSPWTVPGLRRGFARRWMYLRQAVDSGPCELGKIAWHVRGLPRWLAPRGAESSARSAPEGAAGHCDASTVGRAVRPPMEFC